MQSNPASPDQPATGPLLTALRDLDGRFRENREVPGGIDPRLVAADVRAVLAQLFELAGGLPASGQAPERRLAAAVALDPDSRVRLSGRVTAEVLDRVAAVMLQAASSARQRWLHERSAPAPTRPIPPGSESSRAPAIIDSLQKFVFSLSRLDTEAMRAAAAPAAEEMLELLDHLYTAGADLGGQAVCQAARACLRADLPADHDLAPIVAELLEAGSPRQLPALPAVAPPAPVLNRAERRAADRLTLGSSLNRPLLRRLLLHNLSNGKPAWPAELARRLGLRREQIVAEIHVLEAAGVVETAGLESPDTGGAVILNRAGAARYMFGDDLSVRFEGPMPVNVREYRDMTGFAASQSPTPDELKRRLEEVELPDGALEQLQIALSTRSSLLLYGPPGNGKTMLGRLLVSALRPTLMVPVAVETEGLVVMIFDERTHRLTSEQPPDPRWRRVAAPLVELGAEAQLGLLEAWLDAATQSYRLSPALLSSRGVLFIDDLGSQAVPPGQLLDRILPAAERGEISVKLPGTRRQIMLPFSPQIVLATNRQPTDLLSPGTLRRIRHKLYLPDLTAEAFGRVFAREQKRLAIPESPTLTELFQHVARRRPTSGARAVEVLQRIRDFTRARGRDMVVDKDLVESAWRSVYTDQ